MTDWNISVERPPGDEIDHVCRDCQKYIGDDGMSLCGDCTGRAIESRMDALEMNTSPELGQCSKCGHVRHGKDISGLCYMCWRDAEAARCRAYK